MEPTTIECAARGTSSAVERPKFEPDGGFHRELKRRVDAHFAGAGVQRTASPRMHRKTTVILGWFVASYLLLVFGASTWWQGGLLSASLAFAIAAIGFNIQHDANHGAFSTRSTTNRVLGFTLDMLGASSYVWRWKHNVFHHTYTNLDGADDDIQIGLLARLAPEQRRLAIHRVQQFYLWILYGFLLVKWQFIDDFKTLARGRISGNDLPRPRGWQTFELIGGKLLFVTWAFAVPLVAHRWWVVLTFYGTTSFLVGIILSVVFQVAHCGESSTFPARVAETDRVPNAWAVHQIETTVDFAQGNRLLTWYLGGLNFQIEHHLFPKICHLHYPTLAPIVEGACGLFGIRYTAHRDLPRALASHWRWLRRMGRAEPNHTG